MNRYASGCTNQSEGILDRILERGAPFQMTMSTGLAACISPPPLR